MSRIDAVKQEKANAARGWSGQTHIDQDRLAKEWGVSMWKPEVGDNFISIIPPVDEEAYFGTKIFVHYDVGPNGSSFLCPREHKRGPCPICEERERRKAAGADREELSKINPWPPRHLFLVLVTTSATTIAEGIRCFDAAKTINDDILALSEDPRTKEVIDVSDLDNGKDIFFVREGKDMRTKYRSFRLEERSTPITDELLAQIQDMPDLADFLVWHTYDEIAKEFSGSLQFSDRQGDSVPSVATPRTAAPAEGPPVVRQLQSQVVSPAEQLEAELIGDRVRRKLANVEPIPSEPTVSNEPQPEQQEAPVTRTRKRR